MLTLLDPHSLWDPVLQFTLREQKKLNLPLHFKPVILIASMSTKNSYAIVFIFLNVIQNKSLM